MYSRFVSGHQDKFLKHFAIFFFQQLYFLSSHSLAMLSKSLLILLFVSITTCAPVEGEKAKRNFNGVLGSLSGLLGIDATYDYVIIGGGTAGLVMAERLSEDPNLQVAVIEAGSYYEVTNPIIGMTPSGDTMFVGADPSDTNPLVDWNFVTSPQSGANGRSIHYAAGKTLGGRYVDPLSCNLQC
jgi:choline dehydrogenase